MGSKTSFELFEFHTEWDLFVLGIICWHFLFYMLGTNFAVIKNFRTKWWWFKWSYEWYISTGELIHLGVYYFHFQPVESRLWLSVWAVPVPPQCVTAVPACLVALHTFWKCCPITYASLCLFRSPLIQRLVKM